MTSSSFLIPALWLAGALGLHAFEPRLYEAVEPHMGTLVRIKLYANDEAKAGRAFRAGFDRIAALDDTLSDYKPESELTRICRIAIGHPVRVSTDLFRVISAAEELSAASDGAFDMTLGPLTHLWREARTTQRAPETAAIRAAAARCGYRKLHVDAVRQTIELDSSGMELDAGGIAKGYAADEALSALSKLGIESALVAVSGDLAFSDAPPGQPGWKIGIDSLDKDDKPYTQVLLLANAAVSTSGASEQHLDVKGTRYSHIIDPRTGMGLTRQIQVTTVARHGIDADPAATAISVLGPERGLSFVERRQDVAASILLKEDGRWKCVESSRFSKLISAPAIQPE